MEKKKKKAIQEEDVCRAKLLCKPSVDSHPHAGNSLETIPTRCFLLWNIPGQRVTKVSQCSDSYRQALGFRSEIPEGDLQ